MTVIFNVRANYGVELNTLYHNKVLVKRVIRLLKKNPKLEVLISGDTPEISWTERLIVQNGEITTFYNCLVKSNPKDSLPLVQVLTSSPIDTLGKNIDGKNFYVEGEAK